MRNHVKAMACRCGSPPEHCVPDGETLTQYGRAGSPFRCQPRIERELGLSVLRGPLTLEETVRHVLRREPTESDLARSRIRRTSAGRLREAGFAVVHTPGRTSVGVHCTVAWPGAEPIENPQVPWPMEVAAQFQRCFTENEERGCPG